MRPASLSCLTANYTGGSVAVHPIGPDGSLGKMSDFVQHHGGSINPQRQQEPHAHSFTIAADNRFAYAADLGLDKVVIYAQQRARQINAGPHNLGCGSIQAPGHATLTFIPPIVMPMSSMNSIRR